MAADLPSLGELEVRVMQLVWREQPCTERTIWELIRESREVGRTTVLKTIQRLESKKLLVRIKDTSPVQFRAAASEKRVLPELVARFVNGVLGGSADALVAYLADSKELSAKDVEALQKIADKMRETKS
jgi:predicted transcriptional regulator